MKLLFLDTETTGNQLKQDRLCQICYKNDDGTVTELFKPPIPISVKSQSITHITNEMVTDKPAFQESPMYEELAGLLADHTLVAHNALFDIAMLESEGLKAPNFICTLRVARHLDSEGAIPEYNLQFLRYYLKLNVTGVQAHDAEGDVLVLEALFARLLEQAKAQNSNDTEKALASMVEVSSRPILLRTIPFGKHKGAALQDVAARDGRYLEWLLSEKEAEAAKNGTDPLQDDWIYSLRYYLNYPNTPAT